MLNRVKLVFIFSASSKGLLFKPSGATSWKMVYSWNIYPYGMALKYVFLTRRWRGFSITDKWLETFAYFGRFCDLQTRLNWKIKVEWRCKIQGNIETGSREAYWGDVFLCPKKVCDYLYTKKSLMLGWVHPGQASSRLMQCDRAAIFWNRLSLEIWSYYQLISRK